MPRLELLSEHSRQGNIELSKNIITIGRDNDNDVQLSGDMVSRHHCKIFLIGNDYFVQDLNSTNGTLIDGEPIVEKKLKEGDEIKVGNYKLIFRSGAATKMTSIIGKKVSVKLREDSDTSKTMILAPNKNNPELIDTSLIEGKDSRESKALRDLMTIYQVGNAINSVRDFSLLSNTIMDLILKVIKADRGFLILLDDQTGELIPEVIRNNTEEEEIENDHVVLPLSFSIVDKVLEEGNSILSADAMHDDRFSLHDSIIAHHICSAICVPLRGKKGILGLIYLDTVSKSDVFTKDNLRLLTGIGNQAGIALENAKLFEEKKKVLVGALKALVASMEAKDIYTHGHSERVAACSLAICRELNLSKSEIETIELAALLHDIGKIGIPENVLNKPGKLSTEEEKFKQEHPVKGAQILKNITGIEDIVEAVNHHHECFDGSGYPDGLKGFEIPFVSRIIAIADAFDAMTSSRPYRQPLSLEKTINEINKQAGIQFDQLIVQAFLSAHKKGELRKILSDSIE